MRRLIAIDVPDALAIKHGLDNMSVREFLAYIGSSVSLLLVHSRTTFVDLTPELIVKAAGRIGTPVAERQQLNTAAAALRGSEDPDGT